MDLDTYDQLPLTHDQVADAIPFVKENTNVTVRFFKGAPFSVEAPNFVELEVTATEPGFKGDTASNTTKPATVETGFTLQVPLFIEIGDKLKIDTRNGGELPAAHKLAPKPHNMFRAARFAAQFSAFCFKICPCGREVKA